jgi:hypothetical protein
MVVSCEQLWQQFCVPVGVTHSHVLIHVLCLQMRDPYIFDEEDNSVGFNPHLRVLVYTIATSTCSVYWINPDDLIWN